MKRERRSLSYGMPPPKPGDDAEEQAAAWLACRIDIRRAAASGPSERAMALGRIRRAMKRERCKGRAAYDLDRHLALKRCCERLAKGCPTEAETETAPVGAVSCAPALRAHR